MARSNLEATVFVLDVGFSASQKDKDEVQSFFEKAKSCTMRVVERKIFSRPTDLVSLVLIGSQQKNNCVDVALDFVVPSWNFIETIRDDIKSTDREADWFKGLMEAYRLIMDIDNKKIAQRKIILMCDFKSCPDVSDKNLEHIITSFQENKIELIVIGSEILFDEESETANSMSKSKEQIDSENMLKNIIFQLDAIVCTFEEAIFQLLFHKRKPTAPTPWNVDLHLGPDIRIPVSGFPRIRDAKPISQWKKAFKDPVTGSSSTTEAIMREKFFFKRDDNTTSIDSFDVIDGYLYGQTLIPYTKFDKSMEYESGVRCLNVFGFTDETNVTWGNLIGDGVTYVVPRKGDDRSKAALEALVTAMKNLNLVAIARKVYNRNNAAYMNALFPIVEDNCKFLSMVTLAFKEDYRCMLFPPLNQKRYEYNEKQIRAVDNLIDSMDLSCAGKDGKECFPMGKCINPSLQHTFDVIAHRALYPNDPIPSPRPEIAELLETPPNILKMADEAWSQLNNEFKLIAKEKVKSGKYWVDEKLKTENGNGDETTTSSKDRNSDLSALSVINDRVKSIGTVTPSGDFKQLLEYGEPLDQLSSQMEETIERLVFSSLGRDYSKPIEALKTLREECVTSDPQIYNSWLRSFKIKLFEKYRNDFFNRIVQDKLGLVTSSENESSPVSESDAVLFSNVSNTTVNNATNLEEMDSSVIDSLFD